MKFSRADSRFKTFIKSDVSETDSVSIISLRSVLFYKVLGEAVCPRKLY
jgi:hypothetical protein